MDSFRVAALVFAAAPLLAQQVGAPTADLGDLSPEELFSLRVTSVGRKAQRLGRAPAAVFVISQEDIRRSGATTLGEALRMAPGLHVARISGASWAISARGDARQFANRMLVLIDGRSIYTPFFSGVLWEFHDTLLEDVDRIEVIRGPGAVMWGANAVNGVINIITRSARQSQGLLLTAGAGTQDRGLGGLRYGGPVGNRAHYRVYAKYEDRVAIPENSHSERAGFDLRQGSVRTPIETLPQHDWRAFRTGFRLDWDVRQGDEVTLEGDFFDSRLDETQQAPQFSPPFYRFRTRENRPRGGHLLGRWTHGSGAPSETVLQAYYDRMEGHTPLVDYAQETWDLDLHQRRLLSDTHELSWGLGVRGTVGEWNGRGEVSFLRARRTDPLYSAVLADDIQLVPDRWILSLGSRFEHNHYSGFEYQPSVRLLYTPSRRQSAWIGWSRAVRTPARSDHDILLPFALLPTPRLPTLFRSLGDPAFRSEKLHAYEGGYRRQAGQTWSVDASLFSYWYTDLKAYQIRPPAVDLGPQPHVVVDVVASNQRTARSHGFELWGTWNVAARWRLFPSYSYLFSTTTPSYVDPLNPHPGFSRAPDSPHQLRLRTQFDLSPRWQLDGAVYVVDRVPGVGIPGYARWDARVAWRPNRNQEFSAGCFDFLNDSRMEFQPEGPYLATATRRALLVKWTGRF